MKLRGLIVAASMALIASPALVPNDARAQCSQAALRFASGNDILDIINLEVGPVGPLPLQLAFLAFRNDGVPFWDERQSMAGRARFRRTAADVFTVVPGFLDFDTGWVLLQGDGLFSATITHKGSTYQPLCVSP